MMDYRFGKTPARPEAMKFKFSNYALTSKLPMLPKNFGHETTIGGKDWGVLGNDHHSDCVLAGAAHESMLWTRMSQSGPHSNFTEKNVLDAYTAVTGFDPTKPETDQGTDMKDAASWRRRVGITDDQGTAHQIAAYLSVDPGNLIQTYQALYLFGAVGIGIQCPSNVIDLFVAGKPWSVTKGTTIEGGHYVPLVAKRNHLECITWGCVQEMTGAFLGKYCDEAVAYLSEEMLDNRKSPEGFDYDALLADLNSLKPAT